jgi:hypothetical protein
VTEPIGRHIALHRRRRGLSQAAVAGLVGRSESWLSQVEVDTADHRPEVLDDESVPVAQRVLLAERHRLGLER